VINIKTFFFFSFQGLLLQNIWFIYISIKHLITYDHF